MSNISRERIEPKPSYKGMVLIEMKFISLKEINRENKLNTGRDKPTCANQVQAIEKCIREGNYQPYFHEPPMVEYNEEHSEEMGMYDLLTGHHRYQGHRAADETEMYVAVVKFDSEKNRIAAKNLENKKDDSVDFGKNYRTNDDIVNSSKQMLLDMIKNGKIKEKEITQKYLKKFVKKELDVTAASDLEFVVDKLMNDYNIVNKVENWDKKSVNDYAKDREKNNKSWISQMFISTAATKAQERGIHGVLNNKKEMGADYPVTVYVFTGGLDENEVRKFRKNFLKLWKNEEQKILDWADIMRAENYTEPTFVHMKQLPEDVVS